MAFSSLVESWREPLAAAAPDLPTDFLLKWIEKESAGNPCSYTGAQYRESGIFQLMPPDNTRDGGTTEEALRTACVPGTQRAARALTQDEKDIQVASGITYVRHVRDVADQRLKSVGADWPITSPDYWSMVKLVHTLPSLMGGLERATAALGRPPANWQEFVDHGANSIFGAAKWLPFTAEIGAFGEGGPADPGYDPNSSGTMLGFVGLIGVLVGAWWFSRKHGMPAQ